jgi:AbiV family abortive infection protein
MKDHPDIARDRLLPGTARCLKKAANLLDAARVLLEASRPLVASILFSFAIEEFGKATLLHEAYEKSQEAAPTIRGFYDHATKIKKAGEHISQEAMRLVEGAFDHEAFDHSAFHVDVVAGEIARVHEAACCFRMKLPRTSFSCKVPR